MTSFTVAGGKVLQPGGTVVADVVVRDGAISSVEPPAPRAGGVLDAAGLVVAPGYVDLQCNGALGIDLTAEPERIWELASQLPRYGVTSFLPTIVSSPPVTTERAMAALAERPPGFRGAHPLGLHLEGPVLNPVRRGAHPVEHLAAPDVAAARAWSRTAGVAMVTLAPELPGALEVVRALRERDVVVAAGHTDATADEMLAALDAGVAAVTHLFNAMSPFAHRAPGVVGVALTDPRVVAGLIVDGLHVHPTAVAVAWRALGWARLALVTDAVAALGQAGGLATVAGEPVDVGDHGVRNADGRLAGSTCPMDQCVRNLVGFTGCTHEEAVHSASTTPARLLGSLGAAKGTVLPGADADLVLLTPDLHVVATVVAGHVAVDPEGRWRSHSAGDP